MPGEGVGASPWATAPTLRREFHEGLTERAVPCSAAGPSPEKEPEAHRLDLQRVVVGRASWSPLAGCLETVRACIAQRGSAALREVPRNAGTAAASPPAAERRLLADLSRFRGLRKERQAARFSAAGVSISNADPIATSRRRALRRSGPRNRCLRCARPACARRFRRAELAGATGRPTAPPQAQRASPEVGPGQPNYFSVRGIVDLKPRGPISGKAQRLRDVLVNPQPACYGLQGLEGAVQAASSRSVPGPWLVGPC
jgi:hypothetical protein